MKFEPGDIIETDPEGALSKFYYKLRVTAFYMDCNNQPTIDGEVIDCYDLKTHPVGHKVPEAYAFYFRLVERGGTILQEEFNKSLNRLERKLSSYTL